MTAVMHLDQQVACAVYLRISKDDEGDREGVTRQLEDCLAECARRGWQPFVFEDNDISAFSGKHRTAYRSMLDAIRYGRVSAVVAYEGSRLHRSIRENEDFLDLLEQTRIQVVTIRSGEYRWDTADGRAEIRTKAVWDRRESEKMSERIRRAKLQSAQRGEPNAGGRRPYGFDDDKVTHRAVEAEAIRDAARQIIDGVSLKTAAATMGMNHTRAKQVLCSERVAGLRHAGTEVVEAAWEPILDRESWETVRSILQAPGRHPGGVAARRHLLSGFLVCFACGERLQANPTLGVDRYRCPNSHLLRAAGPLEAYVVDRVLARLSSPAVAEALHAHDSSDVDTRALADDAARYEARLRTLKTEYSIEGAWTKAEFTAMRAELEARIAEARSALAARAGAKLADSMPIGSDRIRRAWDSWTLEERRQAVDVVVERIVVKAAGRGAKVFREDTLTIVWRV